MNSKLDELCINTIRMLSADGVQKANSGHPGMPMGAAAMAYVLWTQFLRHNPGNPRWPDRDRFVLSAGHGSMLLYSLLHLSGYDLTLDDINNYRHRVLPADIKAKIAVEAASPQGWDRYVGDMGEIIGLNHFGASAPYQVLYEQFGITAEHVVEKAMALVQKLKH